MPAFNTKKQENVSVPKTSETKLKARSVSRGVAIGKVICLHGDKRQFYKIKIQISQIEREIRRFHASIRLAKRQLKQITSAKLESASETKSNIFDAHSLILSDKSLQTKIETEIREQKVNAEWAVKVVIDNYIAQYKSISDEHLRERYIDLEDVSERILTALGGGKKSVNRPVKNSIIVAKEVNPSTLIELAESNPKAIIAENGGWTSHTFILAREMNLPAVTGLKGILRRVQTGDEVIVDGYNGKVIVTPEKETLKKYKLAAQKFQQINDESTIETNEEIKTLDGKLITIRTNLDLPNAYKQAKKAGAKGIGLYRSEFLFNQNKGFPSEQEQIKEYGKIAKIVGNESVRIRTFDLSIEQIADQNVEKEKNPALGLRAIRLGLTYKKQFRTQIRAILQASFENNIEILFPMISDISEIIQAKKLVEREKENLRKKGLNYGHPKIGAMIEVPAAVFIVDEIVSEVDFICLGTNDLVQYLLAVDRDNETVADWFRTLHPAVIRAIKKVIEAAENKNIPIAICGEMAGSPFYVPILIGLGATELSMNVNSILRVRNVISKIAVEEARDICKQINTCRTSEEVEKVVFSNLHKKWSHLFPTFSFSDKNSINPK